MNVSNEHPGPDQPSGPRTARRAQREIQAKARIRGPSKFATFAFANVAKGVGLYIGAHEALQNTHSPNNSVLALAALFFFGVQAAEGVVLRVIDRFFGVGDYRDGDGE